MKHTTYLNILNKLKKESLLVIALFLSNLLIAQNFTTSGNGVRNAVIGKVKDKSVLYLSEIDGTVSSYTLKGEKLWRNITKDPAVMFEIVSKDINGDAIDELLAASANGKIYCWDNKGELKWEYTPEYKVRFSEIAVVTNKGKVQIFAGGNNYKLYELNAEGKEVSVTDISGVVRKIEPGNFLSKDEESLFLMTYDHDKFRWDFMGILDPVSKKVLKEASLKNPRFKEFKRTMVTDIDIADINNDNISDILFFADFNFKPYMIGLNSEFNILTQYKGSRKEGQRYAHGKGTYLKSKKQITFQYGGILYVFDNKGNLIEKSGEKYGSLVHNDIVFDMDTNQLIAAGEVDGGNAVYFYNVSKNNWWRKTHNMQGRMKEVDQNLNTLYKQLLKFTPPSYQKKSNKEWVMVTSKKISPEVKRLKGGQVKFVIQKSPKEGTDRAHLVQKLGKIALKKDARGKYQDSRQDIVAMAKDFEAKGQPFTFWAGHGNDPFYVQIETLEEVLKVAPKTCYGFVYAEMDKVDDPRVIHFVKEYLPRLAKAIRKNNRAKLYFRYKNMFWAATSHLPLWKEMFFSGKYNDILVPASEDTSNRIQDLNLAGRVGMFSGGYVDDFAMRLIDDNPTSWRPLSPGGQNSISPYLRQGVMMAAYGARHGVIINNNFTKGHGLNVLFALMKSGTLPIVEKEDILSISSWHLIKDVDKHLIHSVDTHHNINQYSESDENAVFSLGQMHWAGTSVPQHDYSNAALGVKYRWLNYMPIMPHGMVPIGPIEAEKMVKKQGKPYFVSNAKAGYNNEGELIEAVNFGAIIKNTVAEGDKNLPILVKGASWSAIKIDENHTRIILVDPGYLDPQDRKVQIVFQNEIPKNVQDILSQETIKLEDHSVKVTVPAGALRCIDVTY